MASFLCCGSRRGPSPEHRPARLVDNSFTRGRFQLSTDVSPASSTNTGEAERSVQQIFKAATDESEEGKAGFLRGHGSVKNTNRYSLERKESMKKIHGIADRVRKSMSRDSGISKHISTRKSLDSPSQRDLQLERISRDRLQPTSHHSDLDGSDYDQDAIAMITPKGTWGKEQAPLIKVTPRRLQAVQSDLFPTINASNLEYSRRDTSGKSFVREDPVITLSRMLTTKNRSLQASSHDEDRKERAEEPDAKESTLIKYIFRDESPEKPPDRTPSPPGVGRSDTVIRTPSSTAVIDLGQPTFLDPVGASSAPDSPDLLPQRMASISDSVAGREWRLSFSPSHHEPLSLPPADHIGQGDEIDVTNGDNDRSLRVTPESWTRGGTFRVPNYQNLIHKVQVHENAATKRKSLCEVEGSGSGRAVEDFEQSKAAEERKRSSGSDSVHLYTMGISHQLASRTLLSLQDSDPSSDQRFAEDHLTNDKINNPSPHPDLQSDEVPLSWNLPKNYAASSIYSHESPHATPSQSDKSSIMFLNKMADRMNRLGPDAPAQDIVSVPAMSNKQINLTQLEDITRETSFHSSNESLTNREIAAAEIRILPRAMTLKEPKNSWFKEDFDEIVAALSKSNVQRRAVSQKVNARPRLSSFDGSMERHLSIQPRSDRFSIVAGGRIDGGASIWEKALREHEEEDEAISRTRAGSDAKLSDRRSFKHRPNRRLDPHQLPNHRHIIDRFSADHKEGEIIKARLDAFQLPTPPRALPSASEPKPSTSPNSYSSWKRYPSHTRHQRSSASAGSADNVFTRDFAEEAASAVRLARVATDNNAIDPTAALPPALLLSPEEFNTRSLKASRKSKSMTFGRIALSKLQELYRSTSLEFASKTAYGSHGHRSSISEGWAEEYPELEMLPPVSPTLSGFDGAEMDILKRKGKLWLEQDKSPVLQVLDDGNDKVVDNSGVGEQVRPGRQKKAEKGTASRPPGANTWSRMYVQECVAYFPNSPPESTGSVVRYKSDVEDNAIETPPLVEAKPHYGDHGEGRQASASFSPGSGVSSAGGMVVSDNRDGNGDGDGDVRSSTLDFKRSLEVLERREREKVLGLGVGTA